MRELGSSLDASISEEIRKQQEIKINDIKTTGLNNSKAVISNERQEVCRLQTYRQLIK